MIAPTLNGLNPFSPSSRLASPETSSIGSSVHSNGALKIAGGANGGLRPSAPSLSTLLGGSNNGSGSGGSASSLAHRAMESFNHRVQSLSTKLPKKAWQEEAASDDEGERKQSCLSYPRA